MPLPDNKGFLYLSGQKFETGLKLFWPTTLVLGAHERGGGLISGPVRGQGATHDVPPWQAQTDEGCPVCLGSISARTLPTALPKAGQHSKTLG